MYDIIKSFQENILQYPKDSDYPVVVELIKDYDAAKLFFELNASILDIALNSIKFRDEATGELKTCNKFDDINLAFIKLDAFINTYSLSEYELIIDMLKFRYREAKTDSDNRPTTAMINVNSKSGIPDYSGFGYFGTYYDLTDIPCWEDIKADYLQRLNN